MPVVGVGHDTGVDVEQLLLEPGKDVRQPGLHVCLLPGIFREVKQLKLMIAA